MPPTGSSLGGPGGEARAPGAEQRRHRGGRGREGWPHRERPGKGLQLARPRSGDGAATLGEPKQTGAREKPALSGVPGLRLYLLGGFRAWVGSRAVDEGAWRLRKARSLVKLLALAPDHRLHRERVQDWLWPELDQEAAANGLHKALHAARRALEPGLGAGRPSAYLQLHGELLILGAKGTLWVDVAAYEGALAVARLARTPEAYQAALEHYGGDLLPEDQYEDWAARRRDELHQQYLNALLEVARLQEGRGAFALAIEALTRVVASEPAHEEAHVGLMRLYALSGQRYQAMRQYHTLEEILRRELDAAPEPASRRLYDEIVQGRLPPGPPQLAGPQAGHGAGQGVGGTRPLPGDARQGDARAASAVGRSTPRHNLPAPRRLIGRQAELAAVRDLLLRDDVRLVTLSGAPGVGKTRLALAVAGDLVEAFPDGVWLVPLAALDEPELVLPTVAKTLGLTEPGDGGGRAPLEAVQAWLRSRRTLLVLDNFEALVEAAPAVAEVLDACPQTKVLVTSRAVLRLSLEHNVVVPPLALPPPGALGPASSGGTDEGGRPETGYRPGTGYTAGAQALLHYGAVQLFVERARGARADFRLGEENAAAVAEICRRLDGVPLAIELAAQRVRLLPPAEMLRHLASRSPRSRAPSPEATADAGLAQGALDLLTGGPRDLPRRQQTLRAAIAWSYHLLDSGEQALLRRLGVFAGGCTLRALLAIAGDAAWSEGGGGAEDRELLERLESLLTKSLIQQEVLPDGTSWLGMLQTIREFALEQLAAGPPGEGAAVRYRHAAYYAALAEEAETELLGPRQIDWLGRLSRELANVRAALRWCLSVEAPGAAAGAGGRPFAGGADGAVPAVALGLRLASALETYWRLSGATGEGRVWLERLLGAAPASAVSPAVRAKALGTAGFLAHQQEDFGAARRLEEEGLALWRRLGEAQPLARALARLGWLAMHQGELARARALLVEALGLARRAGDTWGAAFALSVLNGVERREGQLERAEAVGRESVALFRQVGDAWGTASALGGLAQTALDRAEYPAAAAYWNERLALSRRLGNRGAVAHALDYLATVARLQGDYPHAATLLRESLALRRELGDRRGEAWVLQAMGDLAQDEGDAATARACYGESLAIRRELHDLEGLAGVLGGAAGLAAGAGQATLAMRLAGAASALHAAAGTQPSATARRTLERWLTPARDELDEAGAAAAWAAGRAMTLEATLALVAGSE